jgi:hypothetical protein
MEEGISKTGEGGCRIEKEGEIGSEKEDECSTTVKPMHLF